MLERFFKLHEHGTNIKTEAIAGLTTFLTMSYIIFVNPHILAAAGMPRGALMTTTILAAAIGTLLVGLWANVPLAMAPGMGLNAFFAFSLVKAGLVPNWQTALGVVFISGIFFLIITLFGIREKIVDAIPVPLRMAVAAGIGLFITFIGLKSMGLITKNPVTLVQLGKFSIPLCLALVGLIVTCVLEVKKVKGAILIGIVVTTVLALITGQQSLPAAATLIQTPPSISAIFMKIDISSALSFGLLSAAFSFMFVDLFDSIGTVMACAHSAGMVDKNGSIRDVNKILEADAVATVVGACLGTSTTTTYIESGSGIAVGGRTGLTAVVVAMLFLACLLFTGVIGIVPSYATAPALVMVGVHMFRNIRMINFQDIEIAIPAFLTIIIMPLTYNISLGIAFGFISYIIITVADGNHKKICPVMWGIGLLSFIQLCIQWEVISFIKKMVG
jgi:adenine/guanine/hypoxanthine permease